MALAHLQRENIAPVDLAQAAIGPGMAVYTRYARVLNDADGPYRTQRVFTPVARSTYRWQDYYDQRGAVERVNSRLAGGFGFE